MNFRLLKKIKLVWESIKIIYTLRTKMMEKKCLRFVFLFLWGLGIGKINAICGLVENDHSTVHGERYKRANQFLINNQREEGFTEMYDLAQAGCIQAMRNVGGMFSVGSGVEKDIDKAITWSKESYSEGKKKRFQDLMELEEKSCQDERSFRNFVLDVEEGKISLPEVADSVVGASISIGILYEDSKEEFIKARFWYFLALRHQLVGGKRSV